MLSEENSDYKNLIEENFDTETIKTCEDYYLISEYYAPDYYLWVLEPCYDDDDKEDKQFIRAEPYDLTTKKIIDGHSNSLRDEFGFNRNDYEETLEKYSRVYGRENVFLGGARHSDDHWNGPAVELGINSFPTINRIYEIFVFVKKSAFDNNTMSLVDFDY